MGIEITMSTRRSCAALASVAVVWVAWPLGGCGEDSEPVRVPSAYAHPPDPVPCPERFAQGDSFDARALIGMAERDAAARAREHGCVIRVAVRDGEGQSLTADERADRVDVYVDDGHIVGVRDS
jgi:hypothetical protein